MAGFEDLIRGALQKQGNPSPERREAIYASSRQALERMLSQNSGLDAATVKAQRERLEQAITDVDREYVAAYAANASAASPANSEVEQAHVPDAVPAPYPPEKPTPIQDEPAPIPASPPLVSTYEPEEQDAPDLPPEPVVASPQEPAPVVLEPEVSAEPVSSPSTTDDVPPAVTVETPVQLEPDLGSQSDEAPAHLKTYQGDALQEKKSYVKLLLWTIILVGLGVAGWWAVTFGPDMLKAKFQGTNSGESRTVDSGSFVSDGDDNWVRVFSPQEDATSVDTNGRGTADLFDDNGKTFVRLASNPGSTRNTVRIRVPRGVMQTLQGQAATFEMVIKGSGELPQQFAVFCDFEEMGNCGRQRFKLRKQEGVFVFDVLVNDVALESGEDAYLTFNTDLAATGKSLDLYSIRVRSGP